MLRKVSRAALVAAFYVAVTGLLAPISFGPVQLRLSEGLVLLPVLWPETIPGLWIGCMLANALFGGLGPIDIFGGSAITGVAALLTWRLRRSVWLAGIPPVVLNGALVGAYLSYLLNVPYLPTALSVGAGELAAVYLLGVPLVLALRPVFRAGPAGRGPEVAP